MTRSKRRPSQQGSMSLLWLVSVGTTRVREVFTVRDAVPVGGTAKGHNRFALSEVGSRETPQCRGLCCCECVREMRTPSPGLRRFSVDRRTFLALTAPAMSLATPAAFAAFCDSRFNDFIHLR